MKLIFFEIFMKIYILINLLIKTTFTDNVIEILVVIIYGKKSHNER